MLSWGLFCARDRTRSVQGVRGLRKLRLFGLALALGGLPSFLPSTQCRWFGQPSWWERDQYSDTRGLFSSLFCFPCPDWTRVLDFSNKCPPWPPWPFKSLPPRAVVTCILPLAAWPGLVWPGLKSACYLYIYSSTLRTHGYLFSMSSHVWARDRDGYISKSLSSRPCRR